MSSGAATFGDYYNTIVGSIGAELLTAERTAEHREGMIQQLNIRKDAVSSVSIDEEMVNMLIYQRGFEAAARFMTTIDEMLSLVVNRLGLVGR